MPARRILFLGTAHVSACLWRKGEVIHEATFDNDEAGYLAFAEYLLDKTSSLFYLLADVADEGFQHEELPYVRGSDATALKQRKISQYFFGTELTLAQSQGRSTEGRRDEKFIFAALTRPQQFEPWLAVMHEAGAALVGIYSVPLILPALLGKTATERNRFVLITLTAGGLRQTYFDNGLMWLSRLTPLVTASVEEAAVSAAAEAAKIHQYLVGQRLLTRGERLPVLWLADAKQYPALRHECVDTEELHFELHDIAEVAKLHRLRDALRGSHAEQLFVHVLASKTPSAQFAPESYRRPFRRWQIRTGINAAALIILVSGLLLGARMGIEWYLLGGKTSEATVAEASERQRYDVLVASLPPVPTSPDNLRALSARWDELEKTSPRVVDTLTTISNALQETPQVELDRIDWRLASSPDDMGGQNKQVNAQQTAGQVMYVVADIEAHLPSTMVPDRRAQIGIIDRFMESMKKVPGSETRTLHLPFDTDSGKSLKGTSKDEGKTSSPDALTFSVRYARKVQP